MCEEGNYNMQKTKDDEEKGLGRDALPSSFSLLGRAPLHVATDFPDFR